MKTFAVTLSALAVAITLSACNSASPDTHDADVKAITDSEVQWNQDYAARDFDKVMAHYADDAVLMETGSSALSGKVAIQNAMKGMIADPALSLKFQASHVEVSKSGDMGYTQGTYTLDATDPLSKKVVHDHGSYVTTYRKGADGRWIAVEDIATSAVPPAAPMLEPTKKK
jgi:uncharacterized protein (TIGR02246 family)